MDVKDILHRGLIVSCQALPQEPLHSSSIMARMAYAAKLGGCIGIRANSKKDIQAIKDQVDLPVIGIVKRDYNDSEIYITPTFVEVEEAADAGAEIVALDATGRRRPGGIELEKLVRKIRKVYPKLFIMADISNYEEGRKAVELGFDLVSTTLSSYTPYTKENKLPDFTLIEKLAQNIKVPVIAEGGIWTPEELEKAIKCGAYAAVVGTAITRPREITKRFVKALDGII